MSPAPGNAVLVWDAAGDPRTHAGPVWHWRASADGQGFRSVLGLVERRAESLRSRYLRFIHELGMGPAGEGGIAENLMTRDGISLWWLSLLAEKSYSKSPRISDCLRTLALADELASTRPSRVEVATDDRSLAETFRQLCARLGIGFHWRRMPARRAPVPFHQHLPAGLQGFLWLARYAVTHWPHLAGPPGAWPAAGPAIVICSYTAYTDPQAAAVGRFASDYWTRLPSLAADCGLRINWLQYQVPGEVTPDSAATRAVFARLNERPEANGHHVALQSFFGWRDLFSVAADWIRLSWRAGRLKVRHRFRAPDSDADLWPLLAADWRQSTRGTTAVSGLVVLRSFRNALAALPPQRACLYLREGQAWENALVHAWRTGGRGEPIGVIHSTVRFWDLRHFADPRELAGAATPLPVRVAVNGPVARRRYEEAGWAGECLLSTEALRYLKAREAAGPGTPARPPPEGPLQVLVATGYVADSNARLLDLLRQAMPRMAGRYAFTIKPHPRAPMTAEECRAMGTAMTNSPLGEIIGGFSALVAGNGTAAAIDAVEAGLPVVVQAAEDDLNLSPLRGMAGVRFAGSGAELAAALDEVCGLPPTRRDDYFFSDPELPKWRIILAGLRGKPSD